MKLIFQDYVSYILLAFFAVLAAREAVKHWKPSYVDCHFCKKRGLWHKWKDRYGLMRPICDDPDCINRAMVEEMVAI